MGKPWGRTVLAGVTIGGTVVVPLLQRLSSADGATIQEVTQWPPEPEELSGISYHFDRAPSVSGSSSTVQLSSVSRATPARLWGQLTLR